MIAHLVLPWPPSVNRYWRNVRGRVLVSREGRDYRASVAPVVTPEQQFGAKRIEVGMFASPPDRRRRDLDNLLKAPLDALQAAGLYADDEQIDRLWIWRLPPSPQGWLRVVVSEVAA